MATAKTISIYKLFKENYRFIIKPYQRGYRWDNQQIEYLIKDISSISLTDKYCLQPIIVRPTGTEKEYELVDGQQRLTTLWILKEFYRALTSKIKDRESGDNFQIIYDNKFPLQSIIEKFHKILDENLVVKIADSNDISSLYEIFASDLFCNKERDEKSYRKGEHPDIDYFISNINYIAKYECNANNVGMQGISYYLDYIFKPNQSVLISKNIEVIWYELDPELKSEDPVTVFTNVNANKIKLTNAELIKARLMYEINKNSQPYVAPNSERHSLTRSKLALEWENIERSLDDQFWYFIYGSKGKYVTRIDFLFEIYFKSKEEKVSFSKEFWIYDQISKEIESGTNIEEIWGEIRKIFYTLQDWYKDSSGKVYHLLGLYIAINNSGSEKYNIIKELYKNGYSHNDLVTYLKEKIKCALYKDASESFNRSGLETWLRKLDFDNDKQTIKNVLLTYNIAAIINSENKYEKFPFDLYYSDDYDIEHINPKSKYNGADIDEKERDKNTKRIGNLVLLDSNTNRKEEYKISSFFDKRNIIVRILRKGYDEDKLKYIPIGTRWVFLEAFDNMQSGQSSVVEDEWKKHDDYIKDIVTNLISLLGEGDIELDETEDEQVNQTEAEEV